MIKKKHLKVYEEMNYDDFYEYLKSVDTEVAEYVKKEYLDDEYFYFVEITWEDLEDDFCYYIDYNENSYKYSKQLYDLMCDYLDWILENNINHVEELFWDDWTYGDEF